jgi:predicted enzyme related to lactoylglutathione lyase
MMDFNAKHNLIVWADVPVIDLDRAIDFYSKVLNKKFEKKEMGGMSFAVSEHDQGNGICLVVDPTNVTDNGPLMYFNVGDRIKAATALAVKLSGSIQQPVTSIGSYGFRSVIIDSEGNRIGLHAASKA